MRFVVLLFGLIAVFITAVTGGCFIGFNFVVEALQPTLTDMNYEIPDWAYGSLTGRPHAETGLLLILAAAYGFLGTLISGFLRAGWQGGLLLIFPVLLTTVMNPLAAALTFPQLFTGLLSFLVFPLPIAEPSAAATEDDDD